MSTPATRVRRQIVSAMLAAGVLLLFCAPQIQADCGGHSHGSFQVVSYTESSNPNQDSTDSQSWSAQVVQRVKAFWNGLLSSQAPFGCGSCPQDPASPEKRCEGPFCSGDSAPTALPVPTTSERSNELGYFMGLGDRSRQDRSTLFTDADCLFQSP